MKSYKRESEWSYSTGVFPTLELLKTHADKVTKILLSSKADRNTGAGEIIKLGKERGIDIETDDSQIEKLAKSENVYAMGIFDKYESPIKPGNKLVLVNPSDRGNLGTIIRTMVAFEMKNLEIISPAVDVFDPKVIRASMGGVFRINWDYHPQMIDDNNKYIFMSDGEKEVKQVEFKKPYSLVFGNEGAGLETSYRELGEVVTIEQSGEVDSLNLAMAVGIGLYEARLRLI